MDLEAPCSTKDPFFHMVILSWTATDCISSASSGNHYVHSFFAMQYLWGIDPSYLSLLPKGGSLLELFIMQDIIHSIPTTNILPTVWIQNFIHATPKLTYWHIPPAMLLCFGFCAFWNNRNENYFNHTDNALNHRLSSTRLVEHFTLGCYESSKIPRIPSSIKWLSPPPNFYKLYTDGAFCEASCQGGLGGVVRDTTTN